MTDFINFIEDKSKKEFFYNVKKEANKSWKQIGLDNQIPKCSSERYRNGSVSIPMIVFNKFLNYLSKEDKSVVLNQIKIISSKEWLSLGGKNAYKKNEPIFQYGRLKGLKSMKDRGRKIKTFDFPNFKLSEDICEFVGTFIGDGFFNCYKNKVYQIEFSGDKRFDLDYYTRIVIPIIKREIPELNPRISFVKNKNTIKIRFFSKQLFCFLKQEFGFKPGVKTYTVTIPERIINAGEPYIDRTIRGIFDTDGTVFFDKRKAYKKPYPRISLQIVSEPLYIQLKNYLSRYFSLNEGKNKNRKTYYIEVYGFESLRKWMSKIGFSNDRHLIKLPR